MTRFRPLRDSCENMYSVNESSFAVPSQYHVLEPIGQGVYGLVCSALNKSSGEHVAIKKIEKAFDHIMFTKRALRELRILRYLNHDNIIQIRDVYVSGGKTDFQDIYIVSEILDTDLASILKSRQILSD